MPNWAITRKALGGEVQPLATAAWLRSEVVPQVVDRFNAADARRRLGLYKGEVIPENERNLTDVRNRVSLIIEYELARLTNEYLTEHGEESLFLAYVVANRYPDLEVRKTDGTAGLRFEVKCLQSIAEEKGANFDTLRKDIHPGTDFVIALVWEWEYGGSEDAWERVPLILHAYVLHAMSLAVLRDTYWLNRPSGKDAGGYQGFDLRYAVNCSSGTYAVEEGNYGKLLRIWAPDFEHRPPESEELLDTEQEYLKFRQEAILAGFESLAKFHLPKLSTSGEAVPFLVGGREAGTRTDDVGIVMRSLVGDADALSAAAEIGLRWLLELDSKYSCTGWVQVGEKWEQAFRGRKPKMLSRALFSRDEG